ncbi:MAG: hypothetical protein ABR501_10935, partial [Pyrinomonadaceae bacterium]
MTTQKLSRLVVQLFFIAAVSLPLPTQFANAEPQSAPHIGLNGSLSTGKTQRGRTVRASVEMNIPPGYHINSNRPLEKFLIPTQIRIEAPKGIRLSPVIYPRAVLRNLRFSKNRVAVFEGRVSMRFNITVPRSFPSGPAEIKARA